MKNYLMLLTITIFFSISLSVYAEKLPYQFEFVLELNSDDCPQGSNCLLQSYLAVAIFSDRAIEKRQVGVLLEDYFYCHNVTGNVYRAPVGLETDFLSIPEFAHHKIRPKDFMEAGVIHDWLYAVGEAGEQMMADKIFHDILKEQNASFIKRKIMYKAVRWFGKSSYGARDEIPILDLVTMKKIVPSPVKRPKSTIVANIDCNDMQKFEEIRRTHLSSYYFTSKTDRFFKHKGFVKEGY